VSTASLVLHQSRYDLIRFFREPRTRGFTLATPVLLLVIFSAIFKSSTFTSSGFTVNGDTYYVPRMIVLGLGSASLGNLVITLVAKRQSGALKRRRATPLPAIVMISGDVITSVVSSLSIAVVVVTIGWLAFSTHPKPIGLLGVLLTVVVGAASLSALAYALSPFINSVDAAGPAMLLFMFVVNAISGIYIPESLFPHWMRVLAQVLPIRPLAISMQAAYAPLTNGGRTFAWTDLGIVLAWGVVGCAFAAWRFTWSPSD
jgi:ABC-2 type transport system permease protein